MQPARFLSPWVTEAAGGVSELEAGVSFLLGLPHTHTAARVSNNKPR